MILFFVWIWNPDEFYYKIAVLQANCLEILLYFSTFMAVMLAFWRMRSLKFECETGSGLDDTLLVISQMGSYVFPAYIIISGHHTIAKEPTWEGMTGIASAILETLQSTAQTLFLLDATRRVSTHAKHIKNKPGRQLVTFLLVCNIALWAIDSLEAWRQQLYPQQIKFYGTAAVRSLLYPFSFKVSYTNRKNKEHFLAVDDDNARINALNDLLQISFKVRKIISISYQISVYEILQSGFFLRACSVCLSEVWKSAYKSKNPSVSDVAV